MNDNSLVWMEVRKFIRREIGKGKLVSVIQKKPDLMQRIYSKISEARRQIYYGG